MLQQLSVWSFFKKHDYDAADKQGERRGTDVEDEEKSK